MIIFFMTLGDIGLVPLLLMHTHTGDTRLYLSAEYSESHIGFQAILLQTIVNVATYIGEYSHIKEIFAGSCLKNFLYPTACWMIFGWPLSQPFALYPPFTFSSLLCPACPLQPVLKSLSCNFVGPRRPFCPQAKQAPPGQGKEGTQASKALFSTMGQYWPSNCTLHCYLVKCKWIGKKNDFFL